MYLLPTLILSTCLGTTPTPEAEAPTPEQVRQTVERSLVFLEKSGAKWWSDTKCASCHHVPISVWSLSEAKLRGFAVNDKALDELRTLAFTSYADHPQFTPAGQDGDGKGLSLNTVHLTLAGTAAKPDEKTTEAIKKFTAHLLAKQEADGSWKAHGNLPPVEDTTEVRTLQALLALSLAQDKGLVGDGWTDARDRALAWLGKAKLSDENQSLVFQTLIAQRFGKPEELKRVAKQLQEQQNGDGGWSQTKDRASDALATGQSLYALTVAGLDAQQPPVQRAQAFLTRTQTKDGSWAVPIRAQKNKARALSHYGSGWAAIALLHTLPTAPTEEGATTTTAAPAKAAPASPEK